MKISIVTSYTNPEERMDPWIEAVECYESLADEVVILGENFKQEFSFSDFTPMFNDGFNSSTGDWVIKMDIDTLIHEKDFELLKNTLKRYEDYPAISLRKFQFFTPYRFHTKSRMGMVLNKKKFKNIQFNGGGDGCDPTVNGIHITEKNVPRSNIAFWNYDAVFKTKQVISEDRARFARAWFRKFGDFGDRGGDTPEVAFKAWFEMIESRYRKHVFKLDIEDHPKFIINKLKNIKKDQFGYNLFGLQNSIERTYTDYLEGFRERFFSEFVLSFDKSYKNKNFLNNM